MESTREQIIEKIRKLLSLSDNNPSENEAIAAALKAQKLMADSDVDESELHAGEASEPVEDASDPYMGAAWRGMLAYQVAKNYRCCCYQRNYSTGMGRWARKKEHRQVFIGHPLDAQAAALVFEKLAKVGEELAKRECSKARREHGTAQGVKNTFLLGFVRGVAAELEKQCEALMLVVPSDVRRAFEDLDLRKGRAMRIEYTVNATDAGMAAGRDAVRSGRMGEGQGRLLTA